MGKPILILLLALVVVIVVDGQRTGISPVFRSGMVLDRNGAKIYGRLRKRDKVKVQVVAKNGAMNYSVEAQVNGRAQLWVAQLRDHSAMSNGELFDISMESAQGQQEVLEDVVFGDVFFCSGQSNMALIMDYTFQRDFLRSEMENGQYDDRIRVFSLIGEYIYPEKGESKKPQTILGMDPFTDGWESPSALIATGKFAETSALCLGFAYHLAKQVVSVPIGIIISAYGSSGIEAWMDKRETKRCKGALKNGGSGLALASLYNGMVYPFVNMQMKGVVFYQGESNLENAGVRGRKADGYACLLPRMISSWRSVWNDDNLFFFIVTLAPGSRSRDSYHLPRVRYSQMGAQVDDPFTRVIHAYDLPDPYPRGGPCRNAQCCPSFGEFDFSPVNQCAVRTCDDPIDGPWCSFFTPLRISPVHPRLKFRLSARTASIVASALYQEMDAFSPKFSTCTLSGSTQVDVTFTTGTQSLKIVEPIVPNTAIQYCKDSEKICGCPFWQRKGRSWLCIGGPKAKTKSLPKWTTLETPITLKSSNTITLTLPENAPVYAIRYAWDENPCCDESTDDFKNGISSCPPQNCQILTTNTASLPPDPFFLVLDQTKSTCDHIVN